MPPRIFIDHESQNGNRAIGHGPALSIRYKQNINKVLVLVSDYGLRGKMRVMEETPHLKSSRLNQRAQFHRSVHFLPFRCCHRAAVELTG
jgi:hypothetical protein